MRSKIHMVEGWTADRYAQLQGDLLESHLGLGFDDLPKQPERAVFFATFKRGPLQPYCLELRAVDHVAVREYCLVHYPLDFLYSYEKAIFESFFPKPLKKLGEVTI